jgi:HSPB1-associated protein 1
VEATFKDLFAWLEGSTQTVHAFSAFNPAEVAAYADYKYMSDLFPDASPIELNWRSLGFEYDTVHSTVWVGSRGAHTPLHYDTYGVNLVAQLHGTKTWLLFPPEATPALRPLRVPYEESSVVRCLCCVVRRVISLLLFCNATNLAFDAVHFFFFRPQYAEADGRAMVAQLATDTRGAWDDEIPGFLAKLSAGDMLWVPRHFWHYVECSSDVTVSANLWIDVPDDVDARLEESLVRFWLGSFVSAVEESGLPSDVAWASSEEETESLVDHTVNAQLLLNAVRDRTLATHGRVPSAAPGEVMRKIANAMLSPEIVARLKQELTEHL